MDFAERQRDEFAANRGFVRGGRGCAAAGAFAVSVGGHRDADASAALARSIHRYKLSYTQALAVEHAIKIRDLRLYGRGPIVILESWPRRAWCSVGSGLAGATVLALVGLVLVTVAFVTRFVLGVDVT
jgi:hypothetical protein